MVRKERKITSICIWISVAIMGFIYLANTFIPSWWSIQIPVRWVTYFLNHFGFSILLLWVITYYIDIRKKSHYADGLTQEIVLVIVSGTIFLLLQIKFAPVFLNDYNYYKENGYATIAGEVTKIERNLDAWNTNIYINNDHETDYDLFLGGGIHEGDRVTIYYLPNSRYVFFNIEEGHEVYYDYYDKINNNSSPE